MVKKAIAISLEKNLNLEDVLQCLCAKDNKCGPLITSDNSFVDCGLAIYTVGSFLNEKNSLFNLGSHHILFFIKTGVSKNCWDCYL